MCSEPEYQESNPYEDELVRQSELMWEDYQTNYVPLENQMIEDIEGYRSEEHKAYQKDRGATTARMQTQGTVTAGAGMDPSSGTFMSASNSAQSQSGTAGALGASMGLSTAEDQYIGGMTGMAQMGRGQQATAMEGTSNLASMQAGQDAAELAAQQTISSAKWGAAGTTAGAGTAYGIENDWGMGDTTTGI